MEKEVVKEGLVKVPRDRVKEGQKDVEEIVKQPPTAKGGLLCKLRELKKKLSSHLSCIS